MQGKPQTTPYLGTAVEAQAPTETDSPSPKGFIDLTHSIIISSPVGKSIEEFISTRELLVVSRNAIPCKFPHPM